MRVPLAFLAALVIAAGIAAGASASPAERGGGCPSAGKQVATLSSSAIRKSLLCLFNAERGPNMKRNADLQKAASRHTRLMRRRDCFSHQCPGEASLVKRVKKTGYSRTPYVGEIIKLAVDATSPRGMVNSWMNSPEHRRLILDRRFDHAGVGVSVKGGTILATGVFAHR